MATPISKKRKFVADGVFYAELNELLMRELVRSRDALRLTPPAASRVARRARLRLALPLGRSHPARACRLRTATPAWRSA